MTQIQHSLLLIGESDVGKTHYGAQVLRRMNSGLGTFELVDARNLRPFQTALDNISQGLAAPHTPRSEYTESHWTIRSRTGSLTTDLVWPDYGGELVTAMIGQQVSARDLGGQTDGGVGVDVHGPPEPSFATGGCLHSRRCAA